MEQIRIQKFFTDNQIMSRRAAEREVEAGNVKINGVTAVTGQKIDPLSDIVEYCGQIIKPGGERKNTYIMLNKPRGYLSSASDDRGRRCVTGLVTDCGVRVYPVGRLDMDSEGLLLLTDDGDLTYRLTHPKHDIPKIYHVTLKGEVTNQEILRLCEPLVLDGYTLAPVGVRILSRGGRNTTIEMTLYEGRNRQIRRMCDAVGLKIERLCRVAIGEVTLGSLPTGKWKRLEPEQVDYLYGRKS